MKPENRALPPSALNAVNETAALWLARRDSGFTSAQAAEFAHWRDADPRHAAALRRIETTRQLLLRLPETPAAAALLAEADALSCARPAIIPFSTLWKVGGSLLAAACIALVFLVLPATHEQNAVAYATAAGEHQSITLPDGSTLVLNGGSNVEVAFVSTERRVRLLNGEGHFYVAKNPSRPFFVEAGPVTVRAVGTAFNVRRQIGAVEVLVTEGKVEVNRHRPQADGGTVEPVYLVAGERAFIDGVRDTSIPSPTSPSAAPTFDESSHAPRLMFSNTPLSDVVERFNRYSSLKMEIADAELAQRAVGGNFDADNAESFISLLSVAGDVRVERVSASHVRLHKAP